MPSTARGFSGENMLNFFRSILPSTGNYVLTVGSPKTDGSGGKWFRNYHADTLQELETEARKYDAVADKTVFYALGNFKDNIHEDGSIGRKQAEANMFKTLAFDVDPKDSKQNVLYADQKAMVSTTLAACASIGLPDPVFVSSGYGIHCYYPLTVEIPKDIWIRISSALRDALLATGMALDTGKVCDASMVLRPVGTTNKKQAGAKTVKLLSKTITQFDPMALEQALMKFIKPTKPAKSTKKSSVADAILSNNFPPGDSKLIELRCYQMNVVAQLGGAVSEPLWRLSLGLAKHCVDPLGTSTRWSDKHPEYTPQATAKKMAGWETGPSTCEKFELEDKAACKTCPHRGKIKSPVQLGIDGVSEPVATPTEGAKWPRGYSNKGGKIWHTDSDGESQFVSDYLLYPSARYKDHHSGKTVARVEALLPLEGWQTFELPMDTLAKTAEFSLWLMNHQLFVHNEGTLFAMRKFMLTYMQELQLECESDQMSSSFGWSDDTCTEFVLGRRLIRKDDTGVIRLSHTASDFSDALSPKGSKEEWVAKTAMFNNPGMQLHGLAFLMSVGSPLMVGSGLKSVLVNLFSKDSGTGKTTTGLFGCSAYGSPERLKLTVEDTDNSLFKSMGVYGNLPVYVDEITKACDIPGRLGKIAYFITQGREKRRLTKDGGFQESVEWESISTSSSNKDIYANLGAQDSSYEGQVMRILQFVVDHTTTFPEVGNQTLGYEMSLFLSRNYGMIGEDFIRGIMEYGGPHSLYSRAREQFKTKYSFSFTGKERYWQSAMIIAFVTGNLLSKLGLAQVNTDACIRAGLQAILMLRKTLLDEKLDCFDTLGLYMGENASKTVVFKKNATAGNVGSVQAPYPYEAVARVEAVATASTPFASGRLFINQVHFNEWCHERGVDRRGMMAELKNHGVMIYPDRRIALMRGTGKNLPAVRVFEIEMTHPRFVNVMQQDDLGLLNTGHLKLVGGTEK